MRVVEVLGERDVAILRHLVRGATYAQAGAAPDVRLEGSSVSRRLYNSICPALACAPTPSAAVAAALRADLLTAADVGVTADRWRSARALSARQRSVLELVCRGMTDAEVARGLGLSVDQARWALRGCAKTFGVPNTRARARLVGLALSTGVVAL